MGTRSTVKFYENLNKETFLVAVYNQWDGYIEGVGHDLANFLKDMKVVNGYSSKETDNLANGMGCLAAQYIAVIKDGIGSVYITHKDDEQEFNYEVYLSATNQIMVKVDDMFLGTPQELLEFKEIETDF